MILVSIIIIFGCFIGVIAMILTGKLNRAISALIGALITCFVLIFIEGYDFTIIVSYLFSTAEDGYVNLHSLILIIGMMFIVAIATESGVFQFIAINLIKLSNGKPILLLTIYCFITVFISALLENILAVIILIPLTITLSRILKIDPTPYILVEAILVNIGGTVFSISSIPNILITISAGISFLDFFLNVGLISLVIFAFTVLFFILLFKSQLSIPKEGVSVLKEFNVQIFVQNKRLLYESMMALLILMVLFVTIPSSFISSDIIAIGIAMILVVITKLEPKQVISKIDMELIFYLLGIFIIVGGLETTGFTSAIGEVMSNVGADDIYIQTIFILWISAFLSSNIDNIPITKVLIPVIDVMTVNSNTLDRNQIFYSLAIGSNWGDNLTPLGDNVLVFNIAEQNKRPLSMRLFFKLGFVTTIYQLALMSIYFTFIYHFFTGLIIVVLICSSITIIFLIRKHLPKGLGIKIDIFLNKIRYKIIK